MRLVSVGGFSVPSDNILFRFTSEFVITKAVQFFRHSVCRISELGIGDIKYFDVRMVFAEVRMQIESVDQLENLILITGVSSHALW